jgi:hypothetical protein
LKVPDREPNQVGQILAKRKMAKHFEVTIAVTSLALERRYPQIATEARLDGNATCARSDPTAWTFAPSSTASGTASKPTC